MQRRLFLLLLGILVLASGAAGAQTAEDQLKGLYFELRGGGVLLNDAGIGAGFVDVEASALGLRLVDDSDTMLAYQGLAGVSYGVTRDVSVSLLYSYFATGDPSLTDTAGASVDSEYSSHSLMLGIRFTR